jgi:DNA repair protein RadC
MLKSINAINYIKDCYNGFQYDLHEYFLAIYINRASNIMGHYVFSKGSAVGTIVDISLLLAISCKIRARGVVLVHNHPSGNLRPSEQDKQITSQIKNALNFVDIQTLDHIIITSETMNDDTKHFSFASEGIL